jgi:hypothetical protein
MPQSKPAVKLTEKQWEVLERMETYGGGLHSDGECFQVWKQGKLLFVVERYDAHKLMRAGCIQLFHPLVTDAGRAALAARRAEKDKVANA